MKREGKSRGRWNLLALSGARCGICLPLVIFLCGSGYALAQEQGAPISVVASETIMNFGSPVFLLNNFAKAISGIKTENSAYAGKYEDFKNSAGGKYLETAATLQGIGANVPAAGDGELLFIQNDSALRGAMPFAAGNLLAIAHRDGFVSLYSSNGFIPSKSSKTEIMKGDYIGILANAQGSGKGSYQFRLYDGKSKLWANPALFIQDFNDSVPPKIKQIALLGEKEAYIAENRKNVMQAVPQGNYLLAASIVDPRYKNESVSGLFRIKAVFNGQVIADRKLDSALIAEHGLIFLDMQAPSSSSVDDEGRLLLGKLFLPSGRHTLEVSAYDYVGNEARFSWQFAVQ